jgi:polyisoprenoid-binding protein YceI
MRFDLPMVAGRLGLSPELSREAAMGNWKPGPYHTQVELSAKHPGMMTVRGYFDEITTTADIDPDHPEKSWVEATIQAASIRTNNEARDDDLRSANFLDVERYPVITFKSTGVEPSGPDRYLLTGDLTINGITRPVTLEVVKYGEFNDPGMMGTGSPTAPLPRSTGRTSA